MQYFTVKLLYTVKERIFIRGNGAPLLHQVIQATAPSNEKTITVHSIMVSVKAQIHLGIFSRREMDVRKQEVSEVLTRGTKCAVFGAQVNTFPGKISFMVTLMCFSIKTLTAEFLLVRNNMIPV